MSWRAALGGGETTPEPADAEVSKAEANARVQGHEAAGRGRGLRGRREKEQTPREDRPGAALSPNHIACTSQLIPTCCLLLLAVSGVGNREVVFSSILVSESACLGEDLVRNAWHSLWGCVVSSNKKYLQAAEVSAEEGSWRGAGAAAAAGRTQLQTTTLPNPCRLARLPRLTAANPPRREKAASRSVSAARAGAAGPRLSRALTVAGAAAAAGGVRTAVPVMPVPQLRAACRRQPAPPPHRCSVSLRAQCPHHRPASQYSPRRHRASQRGWCCHRLKRSCSPRRRPVSPREPTPGACPRPRSCHISASSASASLLRV